MDRTQRFLLFFKLIQNQVCKISSITFILFLELRSTMVSTSMSTSVPTSVSTSASTTTFETSATIMTSISTDFPSFNHNLMRSRKRSIRRAYKLIVVMAGFQLTSRRSIILQSFSRQKRRRRNRWKPSFPVYDNIPIYDSEIHGPKPRKSPSPGKCGLLSVPNTSYRITNHSKKGQCLDCDSHGITINKPFNSSHADVLS